MYITSVLSCTEFYMGDSEIELILDLRTLKNIGRGKNLYPLILWFNKKDYEDMLLIFMDKARSYLKNKITQTQMDSLNTIKPESSIKEKEIKASSSNMIN